MELRRFFRAPLLLIAVAVLLLLFVLDYANSGSTYQQKDTAYIVKLIDQGQVKSALLVDKNQTIQITTTSGQKYQASWVTGQGWTCSARCRPSTTRASWSGMRHVSIPKSNALLDLIPTALIYLVIFLLFFFMLSQMQGGGSRVMNFGKSKAKLVSKDTPKTTFADVAQAWTRPSRNCRRSRSSCRPRRSSRPSGPRFPRACCSTARRAPARPCSPGRMASGRRAVLLDLRLGLRRDVRRCRRVPGPRPVRAG